MDSGKIQADCASGVHMNQTARVVVATPPATEDEALRRRLNTYARWNSKKSAMSLATAGFIYTGITDKVECQDCGIRLYNWQEDEDPLTAHKKYAPDCAFMQRKFPQIKAPPKPKQILTIKYPAYKEYEARLRSFNSWPLKTIAQQPEMMARSGFYYIGSADRARCFHCGVTLRDWDTDDYPPCAHRQWSDNCPFVQTLNVDGMKKEIEAAERQEEMRIQFENSNFIDCSSSQNRTPEVLCMDGPSDKAVQNQVITQVADTSPDFGNNPSVQAVIDMGYSMDVIGAVIKMRRDAGATDFPQNAVALFEAVLENE